MIKSFKYRPLKQLYEKGVSARVPTDLRDKLKKALLFLDNMDDPKGVNLPHWKLHRLKGKLKGQWAISVSANYRVTFCFVQGHVEGVNLIDYHRKGV